MKQFLFTLSLFKLHCFRFELCVKGVWILRFRLDLAGEHGVVVVVVGVDFGESWRRLRSTFAAAIGYRSWWWLHCRLSPLAVEVSRENRVFKSHVAAIEFIADLNHGRWPAGPVADEARRRLPSDSGELSRRRRGSRFAWSSFSRISLFFFGCVRFGGFGLCRCDFFFFFLSSTCACVWLLRKCGKEMGIWILVRVLKNLLNLAIFSILLKLIWTLCFQIFI